MKSLLNLITALTLLFGLQFCTEKEVIAPLGNSRSMPAEDNELRPLEPETDIDRYSPSVGAFDLKPIGGDFLSTDNHVLLTDLNSPYFIDKYIDLVKKDIFLYDTDFIGNRVYISQFIAQNEEKPVFTETETQFIIDFPSVVFTYEGYIVETLYIEKQATEAKEFTYKVKFVGVPLELSPVKGTLSTFNNIVFPRDITVDPDFPLSNRPDLKANEKLAFGVDQSLSAASVNSEFWSALGDRNFYLFLNSGQVFGNIRNQDGTVSAVHMNGHVADRMVAPSMRPKIEMDEYTMTFKLLDHKANLDEGNAKAMFDRVVVSRVQNSKGLYDFNAYPSEAAPWKSFTGELRLESNSRVPDAFVQLNRKYAMQTLKHQFILPDDLTSERVVIHDKFEEDLVFATDSKMAIPFESLNIGALRVKMRDEEYIGLGFVVVEGCDFIELDYPAARAAHTSFEMRKKIRIRRTANIRGEFSVATSFFLNNKTVNLPLGTEITYGFLKVKGQ